MAEEAEVFYEDVGGTFAIGLDCHDKLLHATKRESTGSTGE